MEDMEELDRPAREQDEALPAAPGAWNRPLLLAGIGLTLMLGGYAVMNYVPLTPRQAEQERLHDDVREAAAKDTGSAALAERLDRVAPPWRNPPYEIPGRLAVYGGLFLFVAAGVLMYRRPPPRDEPDEAE